jgi:hypothetical protein
MFRISLLKGVASWHRRVVLYKIEGYISKEEEMRREEMRRKERRKDL